MKTYRNIPVNQLFNSTIICGLICNLLVGIIAISFADYTLLTFCIVLGAVSFISYFLLQKNRGNKAVHFLMFSYLLVFTYASFTHIVTYSLILIYPILIGFSNLYFKHSVTKNIYIGISVFACIITIVNTHIFNWGAINIYHLTSSLIIVVGLLFGFVITLLVNTSKIESYKIERKEYEQTIIDKNQALKAYIKTNLQLENFAHLASHDLKTPIKNISNFSQLLDRKLQNRLDPKEQEILNLIKEESQRMSEMMSDLLKLSQLSKKKIKYQKINGHQFINNLIQENFKISKGFIAANSFPLELIGAESHLHILFFNLIENAIKFCDKSEGPKITIYGRRSQNHFYFEVKDNGVGIDDKYKKSVFLIFNKLNPQMNPDGSGIGLSMCREIVDRHNGQIWIEDHDEDGSVVKFTLRRNLEEADLNPQLIEDFGSFEAQIA